MNQYVNEREKQQQQVQTQGKDRDSSQVLPETMNRSPELDFAIAKQEDPTVRLAQKLPSRYRDERPSSSRSEHEDEDVEESGPWDRVFVKTASTKNLTKYVKKQAKMNKTVE